MGNACNFTKEAMNISIVRGERASIYSEILAQSTTGKAKTIHICMASMSVQEV